MNLILSDRPIPSMLPLSANTRVVDLSSLSISSCIGCFGCWTKTPGRCVIRDDAVSVYPLIAQSSRILYVSKLIYGSYDVPMKTMLERAIPVQQAFIRLYHNETHHVQRRVTPKNAVVVAYGNYEIEEQQIFRQLVARNAHNMCFETYKIRFVQEAELEETLCEEVLLWKR